MGKVVGQTKDVGFQFGLRKTFRFPKEQVWAFMFSKAGLDIWLGKLKDDLKLDKTFKTRDGIEGAVRVFKPWSHIRMSWKKPDWENMSTVQVRVIANGEKTIISFHQEKLVDAKQRMEMKAYWNTVMRKLSSALSKRFNG